MAKKKKINAHAKKVSAYMRKHPRSTLAAASKKVARRKNPGRKKKAKKSYKYNKRVHGKIKTEISSVYGPTRDTLTKHQKRVKAGRKAARTRARNLAKKHGKRKGHKKAHRKTHRKTHTVHHRTTAKALRSRVRRARKYNAKLRDKVKSMPKGRQRRRASARLSARRARVSSLSVRVRAKNRKWAGGPFARAHGLTRVNPSMQGLGKDLMTLLPGMGVGAVAFLGTGAAALQVGNYLPDAVKAMIPPSVVPYVPVITSGLLSVVAYGVMRMYPKTAKLSVWALGGGLAATMLHLVATIKVAVPQAGANPDGSPLPDQYVSVGKKYFGLPLGEYVGVSGYVSVNGGKLVPVNGLGEYVGVSGFPVRDASGRVVASVNGMGDYVAQQVGMGGPGEGIFAKNSLGMGSLPNRQSSQVPLNRDWRHGLGSEISVQDVLEGGGTLSGNIFDP